MHFYGDSRLRSLIERYRYARHELAHRVDVVVFLGVVMEVVVMERGGIIMGTLLDVETDDCHEIETILRWQPDKICWMARCTCRSILWLE